VVFGCSQEKASTDPPNPDVVASFNGGVITKDQVNAKFEGLMPCCKGRYQGEEGRRELIKEMVLPVVISRAIKQKRIDIRENIREELGNLQDELNMSFLHIKFHEQILSSKEEYVDLKKSYEFQKKRLEGFPLSERYQRLVQLHQKIHPNIAGDVEVVAQDYIQKMRREASITKNFDVLKVQVTAGELKDFYNSHKEGLHGDEYQVPEKVGIQEIVIKSDKDKDDCPTCMVEKEIQAKEKAESALLELRSGADFQTVAQKFASNGAGAMQSRWFSRGSNPKEFEEAVFSLEIGEVSQVLEKEKAFHIIKVLEKQPGRFKSYEEILTPLEREYRWQKGEEYLKENRDRILFTINSKPFTIGDFLDEYTRTTPPHQCHHMEGGMDQPDHKMDNPQLCDIAHNDFEEQKTFVNRMIDRELITEDTYNQMIHVEHQKEIEFLTMASLYPIFHREEMDNLIHISDDMVEQYYQKKKKAYMYPAKAKLSMIVIKGGEKETDKKNAFEKAKMVYKELKPSFLSFKKKKDFAEVARKYSEDKDSASRGGRLEVDVYECRNEIEYMLFHGFHQEIFALKSGDISEVFEFGNDYYIIQIREMESRKQLAFEEIREKVKKDLFDSKHQKVMENWESDLLRSAGFKIYDQRLSEILADTKEPQNIKES
jgi:parvulin-like peptidyl-prolyl isomerase